MEQTRMDRSNGGALGPTPMWISSLKTMTEAMEEDQQTFIYDPNIKKKLPEVNHNEMIIVNEYDANGSMDGYLEDINKRLTSLLNKYFGSKELYEDRFSHDTDDSYSAASCLFIHDLYLSLLYYFIRSLSNCAQPYFFSCFLRQVREEFRDGIGPFNDSGENPPPVTIHTWLERFNKQNPHSFDNAAAPKDAENRISHLEEILMFSRQGECRHAARNCFKYGQTGHLQQDDKKDTATKELPGISSIRDVEYDIEFASGAKPIAEAPYRISPVKCGIYGVDKSSFHKFLDKFVIMLIDDILIFSKSNEEHEDHLRTVIQILRQEKLYAKFSKCKFWLSKVVFLGHVVPAEGITMDPAKVEVVTKWPRSTSETEARSFLGLAGHYHRVVEGSSRLALPLTKLTRKDEKLYGPESERRSLKNLSNV
ncbi:putative reverse transcriptase domain-containing protein [Tanacetum coccineum]